MALTLQNELASMSSSEDQMDEFQFPWKQRQILTFDIPVHDSERAGLGVSVKGKTSTSKGTNPCTMFSLRQPPCAP